MPNVFDPSESRRARYTLYVNSACCAGWVVINAIAAWVLNAPRLLGLSASALAMIVCWAIALRDLRLGRVMRGVTNYVVSGLLLLLAMSLSVPEMSLLFVFATLIFLAFGLSYADRRASTWIMILTLGVAATMLVTSLGLRWTSGVDADVIRWVNLVGLVMALAIDATQFVALRTTLEARGERLHASEARKAAIMEAVLDAIVVMNEHGEIVDFNSAAESLFGYVREDVIGRSLGEVIVPPELRDRHANGLRRYLDTNTPRVLGKRLEMSAMRKDGSVFPAEIAVVRIRGDGPPMFAGHIRDMTAQKRAEEGNALWAHALEQATFGVVVSDPTDRRVMRVNPSYARMLQYEPEALLGISGEDLIAPASREELPSVADSLRARGSYTYGLRLLRRDGSTVPVLVSTSPVITTSGAKLLVSTIVDVSERDQLAREREEAAARLGIVSSAAHDFASASGDIDALLELVARRLAETIGDGCAVRLLSDDGRWLEPSASFYHRDPAAHEAARRVLGSERQPVGEGIAGQVAATGEAILIPEIETDKVVEASMLAIPLRSHGRTTGVVSMLRDRSKTPYTIDDQRLAQDLADRAGLAIDNARLVATLERRVRERTADLEAANRELETFTYSASHDLRTPLRAIDGFSRALAEDCADRLDEEGRRYLSRIRAATQRMGKLIDDLLNLARIGRAPLQLGTVDVTRIATDIVADMKSRDLARTVATTIAPNLTTRADGRLVTIMLENLLGNAWKFTAKTPAAMIEVGVRDGALFVRDNGAGFDMAYASKLFAPFQRLHDASEFAGDGIGLATVSRIVAHHHGRIWVEAAVGKGATFFFTLGDQR